MTSIPAKVQAVIEVTGTGFVSASVVHIGGEPVATEYASPTQVDATYTPAAQGTFDVTVVNDSVVSNAVPITVTPPPPSIFLIIPQFVSPDYPTTINIFGGPFEQGAVVLIDGTPAADLANVEPMAVTPTMIVMVVSLAVGDHTIVVRNPDDQESNSYPFPARLPTLTSITPDTISLAAGTVGVTAIGSGFNVGDYLYIGTQWYTLNGGSAGAVAGSIDPTLLGVGTFEAYVSVASGTYLSNKLPFTVTA